MGNQQAVALVDVLFHPDPGALTDIIQIVRVALSPRGSQIAEFLEDFSMLPDMLFQLFGWDGLKLAHDRFFGGEVISHHFFQVTEQFRHLRSGIGSAGQFIQMLDAMTQLGVLRIDFRMS